VKCCTPPFSMSEKYKAGMKQARAQYETISRHIYIFGCFWTPFLQDIGKHRGFWKAAIFIAQIGTENDR
jgi:hypothetical protein